MRQPRSSLPFLVLLMTACSSGDASTDAVDVVRRDSAGIAIVDNVGADSPLDWTLEEVRRLGGADDGPEAFFQPRVGTDARGRIYVLDRGNHQVLLFDATGAHLRTFGGKGGGPGELQMPADISVLPDGTVGVQDWGKGSIVVWDSAGAVAPEIRLERPMLWALDGLPDGFVGQFATMSGFGEAADSTTYELVRLGADADTSAFLTMRVAPGREVDFGCVRISSMEPLFQPNLRWTTTDGRIVVATSARYELTLRDPTGAITGIVRRDVEPEPATAELAAQEVGDSMRVGFGGGRECAVPPDRVVEQRGHAELVPAVREIGAWSDGGFFVGRGVGRAKDQSLDVFDADGAYLGTLPAGTPRPHAFLPDGSFVTIETDEYDLPYVVVYRVRTQASREEG